MRTLTNAQLTNVDETATKPVYLVSWEHSGATELVACTGVHAGQYITYDSEAYEGGYIDIRSIVNYRSATLEIPATTDRIAEVQNGTWRRGLCYIYYVPAAIGDSGSYTTDEAILILPGRIRSSKWSRDKVTVSVVHESMDRNLTPRITAERVMNHIPPPNSILLWDGENIVLAGTR